MRSTSAAVVAFCLIACGNGSNGTAGSGGVGAAGGFGATGAGGAAGAAAGSSTGGGSGSSSVDCAGAFGAPKVLFSAATSLVVATPSITADEREIYYLSASATDRTQPVHFVFRSRASADETFGDEQAVPGVSDCTTPGASVDVSDNGLRLYVSCWSAADQLTEVRVAQRARRGDPFVDGGVVAMAGVSAAVSHDELTLYSTGLNFMQPLEASRSNLTDDFGDATAISGLETRAFVSPDVSANGLVLFGTENGALGTASRASVDAPFTGFTAIDNLPPNPSSPSISADCRTLYFDGIPPGGGSAIFSAQR